MKKFFRLIILLFLLVGCVPSQLEPSSMPSPLPPTLTLIPTSTETPTSTITPSPTLVLPVEYQTPIPISNTQITSENIKDLREVARYYSDIEFIAKLTADKKLLFIRDTSGVSIYDYNSLTRLDQVAISVENSPNFQPEYLQVSNNGEWALADNRWLLQFQDGKKVEILDLNNIIVHDIRDAGFGMSLSSDGSKLAVSEYNCSHNPCWFGFQIIATNDRRVLYHWDRSNSYQLHGLNPLFSPDGSLIATVNPVFSPDGGPWAGAFINIWSATDGAKIASIIVESPFVGLMGDFAFSDNSLSIAIRRNNRVKIYDPLSGEKLSETTYFPPGFLEEQINVSPYLLGPWGKYSAQYYFQFSDINKLIFGNEIYGKSYQSCSLSLDDGNANCSTNSDTFKLLGTDQEFYTYRITKNNVEFRKDSSSSGDIYYSLPWNGYVIRVHALDPLHNLIIYSVGSDSYHSKVYIKDIESNKSILDWEGEVYLSPGALTFSDDKRYAALCIKKKLSGALKTDGLYILDLSQKKVVYSESFTCGTPISLSSDGSKLAANFFYLKNAGDRYYSSKIMVMDISDSFKKTYFEVDADCWYLTSIAFSPDESFLTAACVKGGVRFINPTDGTEIYRIDAYPYITDFAFSKDGSMLAASAGWGAISIWEIQTTEP